MFSFSRENTSFIAKWWRNIDKQILLLFTFLFLLGLFFSFSSTSSIVAEKMNKQTYFFFIKHFIFVIISMFLFLSISIFNSNKLIKLLPFLFLVSILLLCLVPLFGVEVKGSKRWLDLPFFPRFQPIELVKPLFIVFIAKIITLSDELNIYKRYFYSFLILIFIVIFLINQPDLGQTLLLVSSWITVIFVSGFSMIILTILVFLFLTLASLLIFFSPERFGYIISRLKTFLDRDSNFTPFIIV